MAAAIAGSPVSRPSAADDASRDRWSPRTAAATRADSRRSAAVPSANPAPRRHRDRRRRRCNRPGTLSQQQRGVAGRHRHEPVAAARRDGALARGQQRIIGTRERNPVDQHQRQRRGRARRRPAKATGRRTATSPRRRRTVAPRWRWCPRPGTAPASTGVRPSPRRSPWRAPHRREQAQGAPARGVDQRLDLVELGAASRCRRARAGADAWPRTGSRTWRGRTATRRPARATCARLPPRGQSPGRGHPVEVARRWSASPRSAPRWSARRACVRNNPDTDSGATRRMACSPTPPRWFSSWSSHTTSMRSGSPGRTNPGCVAISPIIGHRGDGLGARRRRPAGPSGWCRSRDRIANAPRRAARSGRWPSRRRGGRCDPRCGVEIAEARLAPAAFHAVGEFVGDQPADPPLAPRPARWPRVPRWPRW